MQSQCVVRGLSVKSLPGGSEVEIELEITTSGGSLLKPRAKLIVLKTQFYEGVIDRILTNTSSTSTVGNQN